MGSRLKVALIGLGNCAGSLIEALAYYRSRPNDTAGILFPKIGDYTIADIDVVLAFDVSALKVHLPISEALYKEPNNFIRIDGVKVPFDGPVLRGPTLDGNPIHLSGLVPEATCKEDDVPAALERHEASVVVNLLPTGSMKATEYYARAAAASRCAFVNCIPTPIAQLPEYTSLFESQKTVLLGDDIKSQVGTTILHRAILKMLKSRGARIDKSSQVNLGGNTDFANFVHRAETKLISKRKSLMRYVTADVSHVGHHFDPSLGPYKRAHLNVTATVFGGSKVEISVVLNSDDKPNCAGSIVDLIRIAKSAVDSGQYGCVPEACALYMKSPPVDMEDSTAHDMVSANWGRGNMAPLG